MNGKEQSELVLYRISDTLLGAAADIPEESRMAISSILGLLYEQGFEHPHGLFAYVRGLPNVLDETVLDETGELHTDKGSNYEAFKWVFLAALKEADIELAAS